MKIEINAVGQYQLITIEEDLSVISDLQELYYIVEGYVKQGKSRIAVKFPGTSYIYSGALAVLLKCFRTAQDDGGEFCVIESNPDIRNIFTVLALDKALEVLDNEEELLGRSLQPKVSRRID